MLASPTSIVLDFCDLEQMMKACMAARYVSSGPLLQKGVFGALLTVGRL